MAHIVRAIPLPPLARKRRTAVWRFVLPGGDPARPCLNVMALILNGPGYRGGLLSFAFGLSVSHHALGRLLDRTMFRADPAAAILEAHDTLLTLDPDEARRLFVLPHFQLPGAGGAFLVTSPIADEGPMPIAATWVDVDQLYADQGRHAAAWTRLMQSPAATGGSNVPSTTLEKRP